MWRIIISRKELKHDKIKETLEHGAEAVYSHGQLTLAVLLVVSWWPPPDTAAGEFTTIAKLRKLPRPSTRH